MSDTLYNFCCNRASCPAEIPVHISKCPNCCTPVKTTVCTQCFRYIRNLDDTCPFCNHVVKNPPKYIPCIICFTLLEISNNDVCYVCKTPQDYSELQGMAYKTCSRSQCATILPFKCTKCYRCSELQSSTLVSFPQTQSPYEPQAISLSFEQITQIGTSTSRSILLRHLEDQKYSPKKQADVTSASNVHTRKATMAEVQDKCLRVCGQCFQSFSESQEESIKCPSCNHVLGDAPQFIPCILCNQMLEISNSNKCFKCSTPQDYVVLQTMSFKVCSSSSCSGVIPLDLKKCCFCNQEQSLCDSIKPIPFEGVQVKSILLEHLKSRPPNYAMISGTNVQCPQCFQVSNLPLHGFMICPSCKHLLGDQPRFIPCIICNHMLEIAGNCDKCAICTTLQDYSALQIMSFKVCCNNKCKCILPLEKMKCYCCGTKQVLDKVDPIPLEKLPNLNVRLLEHLKAKQGSVHADHFAKQSTQLLNTDVNQTESWSHVKEDRAVVSQNKSEQDVEEFVLLDEFIEIKKIEEATQQNLANCQTHLQTETNGDLTIEKDNAGNKDVNVPLQVKTATWEQSNPLLTAGKEKLSCHRLNQPVYMS